MNDMAIQLIPIVIVCILGLVIAYYVYQLLDFIIGITIFVVVALMILYQFYSPTSVLHQALPGVPVLFHDMPQIRLTNH